MSQTSYTVFTWLNAMVTISNLLNFDVATIQGRPLIEGGVYCTEAPSMRLLFNIVRSSLRQVRSLVCLTRCFQELKDDLR